MAILMRPLFGVYFLVLAQLILEMGDHISRNQLAVVREPSEGGAQGSIKHAVHADNLLIGKAIQ
jgi:hypothetical protein